MHQVVTPEEMAALLAGLQEAEAILDCQGSAPPGEIQPRGWRLPEFQKISLRKNLSNWLRGLAQGTGPFV
jgi:hypothetical protein